MGSTEPPAASGPVTTLASHCPTATLPPLPRPERRRQPKERRTSPRTFLPSPARHLPSHGPRRLRIPSWPQPNAHRRGGCRGEGIGGNAQPPLAALKDYLKITSRAQPNPDRRGGCRGEGAGGNTRPPLAAHTRAMRARSFSEAPSPNASHPSTDFITKTTTTTVAINLSGDPGETQARERLVVVRPSHGLLRRLRLDLGLARRHGLASRASSTRTA